MADKSAVHQRVGIHQEESQTCVEAASIRNILDVLLGNLYGDGVDEILKIMKVLGREQV